MKFVWQVKYSTYFYICKVFLLFIHLIFQPQIIGNHRDKLAISRLSSIILNGISKIGIEGIFAFTFREKYAIL